MRYALALGIFLLMLPATLFAETRYVSEVREITLRTGPSTEHKIISMVTSGTPMTVLDTSKDWTQVQIPGGKEGWVRTQYLQAKVPDTILLENLQKKYDTLSSEADTLRNENVELKTRATALASDLETCRSEFGTLSSTHEALKTDSADFLDLQSTHEKTVKELAVQKEKADRLEDELSGLINDKRLTYFLFGAGVLLVGIVIGLIFKPQRRRSSLL